MSEDPFSPYRHLLYEATRQAVGNLTASHGELLRQKLSASEPTSEGRLFPSLLCLLATDALTGQADAGLPAATALALLAEMSEVFGGLAAADSEDAPPSGLTQSWGLPRALNAGDAFFALAQECLLQSQLTTLYPERQLRALQLLDKAARITAEELYGRATSGPLPKETIAAGADIPADEQLAIGVELGGLFGGADNEATAGLAQIARAMRRFSAPDEGALLGANISKRARERLLLAGKYIEEVAGR